MYEQLIESIQSSGFKACIVISGGGSGAVHAVLGQPGASRFVLDVQIPYCREAMNEYLGEIPESYCSEQTAQLMAETAFDHASRFSDRPLGIACTAVLATTEARSDPDRAFISFCSSEKKECYRVELSEGTRRSQEDELRAAVIEGLYHFVC